MSGDDTGQRTVLPETPVSPKLTRNDTRTLAKVFPYLLAFLGISGGAGGVVTLDLQGVAEKQATIQRLESDKAWLLAEWNACRKRVGAPVATEVDAMREIPESAREAVR